MNALQYGGRNNRTITQPTLNGTQGFMRGSLCSAHSRGGVSPGRPKSNWTCKWKWTIWDTNDEGVEEGECPLHQTTNQNAGPGSEWVHGGKWGSEEGELLKGLAGTQTQNNPLNLSKDTSNRSQPPSQQGMSVCKAERGRKRERKGECLQWDSGSV